jgi:hypothetical protein
VCHQEGLLCRKKKNLIIRRIISGQKHIEKPSLQSKFYSFQNSLFQNTNDKFGGKKTYFANERVPKKLPIAQNVWETLL